MGENYPHPIVDIKENWKRASDILWNMKDDPEVRRESFRILKRHTISQRNRLFKDE